MYLPYTITLGLFAVAGLALAIWSGLKISRTLESKEWVKVDATVKHEAPEKKTEFNLPQITYHYSVDGKDYQQIIDSNIEESPMPGQTHPVLNKYPADSTLHVYYDPEHPANSTLRNGAQPEDWVLFWIGISTMLLGIATFLNVQV